jgi:hypothetical protein
MAFVVQELRLKERENKGVLRNRSEKKRRHAGV